MLGSRVLAVATSPGFSAWAVSTMGARLPIAMAPLAFVLMGVTTTGSYVVGGLLVAAHTVGEIAGSPLMGRLMDAWPSKIFLAVVLAAQALGFVLVAVMLDSHTNVILVCVTVLIVGAVPAGIPGALRSNLVDLVRTDRRATALSIDNVLNQLSWALGPVIVALVGIGAKPWFLAAWVAAPALIGALATCGLRTPDSHEENEDSHGGLLSIIAAVRGPVCLTVVLRLSLGVLSVAAAAMFETLDAPGLAGVALGCYAVATGVSSLLLGPVLSQPAKESLTAIAGLGILGIVLVAAVVLVNSAAGLLALYAVAGFVEGPVVVAIVSRVQRAVPRQRMTTAFSVQYAALGVGFAMGTSAFGPLAGFTSNAVAVASVGVVITALAISALAIRRWRNFRRRQPDRKDRQSATNC